MGFFDLFRPKWQHSDPEVRQDAVRALGEGDEATIAKVARADKDARVRRIAVKKLADLDVLDSVAGDDPDEGLRKTAAEMAAQIRIDRARKGGDAARGAIGQLTDEDHIAEVARTTEDAEIRKLALSRLREPSQLVAVARTAKDAATRDAALGRIGDEKTLTEIALNETSREVSTAVVERINDVEALDRIAQNAKNKAVRKAARAKLDAIPPSEKPVVEVAPAARREARQLQLIKAVERLISRADAAGVETEMAELKAGWDELGALAEGEATLGQRWAGTWKRLEERRALHEAAVRARVEESERLQREEAERQQLVERAEAWKPGEGAQAQLGELRSAWQRLSGPGQKVPRALADRFRRAVDKAAEQLGQAELVEKERARDEARRRRDEEKSEARRIRDEEKHRTDAAKEEERKKRDEERRLRDEEKQKKAQENLPRAEELCLQVEGLASNEDTKLVDKDLKAAVAAWSDLALPKGPEGQALRDRFNAARDKVVLRLRELHEAKDWERWANVAKLEALCTRVEKLREVEDVKKLAAELKAAQADWKKVGAAPKEKSAALWLRFKTTCDELYKKCQEHFAVLDAGRQENLTKKQELVAKVEALADSDAWKDTSEAIKQLQTEWKGVGPVPKAEADALWKRFRGACDRFFERRKAHFGQMDEERAANLKRKEELCQDAEKVAASSDWREAMKVIRQLQSDWKLVGPVPKAQSDALWQRFRAACDKVFEAARAHNDQQQATRKETEGDKSEAEAVQKEWKKATLGDLLKGRTPLAQKPAAEPAPETPEPSKNE